MSKSLPVNPATHPVPAKRAAGTTRPAAGLLVAAAAAALVPLAGGCGLTAKPREVRHTVNGVEYTADGRPVTDPGKRAGGAATRPVADPWGPPLAGVPGIGAVRAVPVNVFGEMGGPRPLSRVVGDAGFQQHTFTDEGGDADVAVDPTGRWMVYASTRHNEFTDIYMQRVDGTSVTQLTSDAAADAFPSFSPDGKKVCFASTRAGVWQIYLMNTDGRGVVQVTSGSMQCVHPSFSPDGTRIAYAAIGSRSAQWELWVADLRSGEKRMVGYGLFPRWSPNKGVDRIAFQKHRQRGTRWFSLWTLDLVDGEGRRLTEVASSPNAAIVAPSWSPDGNRLAFATIVEPGRLGAETDARRAAVAKQYGQQDVWTIDADGGNRQRLTDGNGTNLSPFWAADHRVYFISDRGGAECVWSARADPTPAFDVAKDDRAPRRSPVPGPARTRPSSRAPRRTRSRPADRSARTLRTT
jgi:TolB protein